jgi:hypothetical protein
MDGCSALVPALPRWPCPTASEPNVLDGLEVELCRGDATFPRAADKYGEG